MLQFFGFVGNLGRKENGGDEHPRKYQYKLLETGNHNFQKDGVTSKAGKKGFEQAFKNKTHVMFDKEYMQKLTSKAGKASAKKQIEAGTHITSTEYICPHCGKKGKGPVMFKYHFSNCKGIN